MIPCQFRFTTTVLPCLFFLLFLNSCGDRKSQDESHTQDQSPKQPTTPITRPASPEGMQNPNMERADVFISEGGLREKTIADGGGDEIHQAALAARKHLGEELMAVLHDRNKAEKLILDRWNDAVKALPETQLPSSGQSDIKEGKRLPSECLEVLQSDQQFVSSLLKGERASVQTPEAIAAAGVIQMLAIGMTDNLPAVLGEGEAEWPPTEGDRKSVV